MTWPKDTFLTQPCYFVRYLQDRSICTEDNALSHFKLPSHLFLSCHKFIQSEGCPHTGFFVPTYSLKPLKKENLLSTTPKTEFELTFPTRKVFFIFSKFPLMAVNCKKLYVPSLRILYKCLVAFMTWNLWLPNCPVAHLMGDQNTFNNKAKIFKLNLNNSHPEKETKKNLLKLLVLCFSFVLLQLQMKNKGEICKEVKPHKKFPSGNC